MFYVCKARNVQGIYVQKLISRYGFQTNWKTLQWIFRDQNLQKICLHLKEERKKKRD